MSKISTIYDKLLVEFAELFPSKTILPNPYSLEDNSELYLNDGWGLAVGTGIPSSIDYLKEDTETREFNLILTRKLYRLENDTDIIVTDSKLLLEDMRLAKNDLLDHDQIEIYETIQRINFVSASGVQFVQAEKFSFIFGTLTFTIEYSETI